MKAIRPRAVASVARAPVPGQGVSTEGHVAAAEGGVSPAKPAKGFVCTTSPTEAAEHETAAAASRQRQCANNRVLMLCTALGKNDTPLWPFWKWQQLRKARGVTDLVMLAVTREQSFVARIDHGLSSLTPLPRGHHTVDPALLRRFFATWYKEGGGNFLVYGGHGVSDHMEFEHRRQTLMMHELSAVLGERSFDGMLFDACLMASLDTAAHLAKHTRYIGAAEGYMWEEDTWHENHIFTPHAASLMTRARDPRKVLHRIGEEYTRKSPMADYAVLDTTHAVELHRRVVDRHLARIHTDHVALKPDVAAGTAPVLHGATEREMQRNLAAAQRPEAAPHVPVADKAPAAGATAGPVALGQGDAAEPAVVTERARHIGAAVPPAMTQAGLAIPRTPAYRWNYAVGGALYPDEAEDGHIVDLYAHIQDDPEAAALFRSVVAHHTPPANADAYATPLHGLNWALGQYSAAARPPAFAPAAPDLAPKATTAAAASVAAAPTVSDGAVDLRARRMQAR